MYKLSKKQTKVLGKVLVAHVDWDVAPACERQWSQSTWATLAITKGPAKANANCNDSGNHFEPIPKPDEATISQAKMPYDPA